MAPPQTQTIALFGATGGTGLAVLKNALKNGHNVRVLARSPDKLSSIREKYPNTLHLVQGDIRDISAIKSTLVTEMGKLADIIVTSIGMITFDDPKLCEDGTAAILKALGEVEKEGRGSAKDGKGPKIVVLSSTGITKTKRDLPLVMVLVYRLFAHVPHVDKAVMEEIVRKSGRRWVIVRPSFFVDGEAKGLDKVRVSVESPEKGFEKLQIGYTIRRDDVGLWISENCIQREGEEWVGKMVGLTY